MAPIWAVSPSWALDRSCAGGHGCGNFGLALPPYTELAHAVWLGCRCGDQYNSLSMAGTERGARRRSPRPRTAIALRPNPKPRRRRLETRRSSWSVCRSEAIALGADSYDIIGGR